MPDDNKPASSFLQRLKQRTANETPYGGVCTDTSASMQARDCPNCGAGRAQQDGLTQCAYCGFEFMSATLSDGIHIKAKDN